MRKGFFLRPAPLRKPSASYLWPFDWWPNAVLIAEGRTTQRWCGLRGLGRARTTAIADELWTWTSKSGNQARATDGVTGNVQMRFRWDVFGLHSFRDWAEAGATHIYGSRRCTRIINTRYAMVSDMNELMKCSSGCYWYYKLHEFSTTITRASYQCDYGVPLCCVYACCWASSSDHQSYTHLTIVIIRVCVFGYQLITNSSWGEISFYSRSTIWVVAGPVVLF